MHKWKPRENVPQIKTWIKHVFWKDTHQNEAGTPHIFSTHRFPCHSNSCLYPTYWRWCHIAISISICKSRAKKLTFDVPLIIHDSLGFRISLGFCWQVRRLKWIFYADAQTAADFFLSLPAICRTMGLVCVCVRLHTVCGLGFVKLAIEIWCKL